MARTDRKVEQITFFVTEKMMVDIDRMAAEQVAHLPGWKPSRSRLICGIIEQAIAADNARPEEPAPSSKSTKIARPK